MRHKAGWFVPQQVLALTHLASEVTSEDYMEIAGIMQACLQQVTRPFHMVLDNRNIKSEQVVSLETILQATPQLQSLPLRWIIMILPYSLQERANTREMQRVGDVRLMHVDTLAAAFEALRSIDASLNWDLQVSDFFAEDR